MVYFNIGIRYLLAAGLAFLLFYVIFRKKFRIKRIQATFPKTADYRRDLLYSLLTVFFFTIIALLTFFVLRPHTLLYDSLGEKTVWYWLLTVIPMFFIHDFYFYWAHRLMHHPRLFRAVHKIHHLSTAIILILAFTVPTHAFIIMLFMIFQIIYNVYGHLGYELFPKGFHKTRIGKYVNTSVAHNQHHARFHGNYGLYTLIWDRLFGTIREDYDKSFEQATERA